MPSRYDSLYNLERDMGTLRRAFSNADIRELPDETVGQAKRPGIVFPDGEVAGDFAVRAGNYLTGIWNRSHGSPKTSDQFLLPLGNVVTSRAPEENEHFVMYALTENLSAFIDIYETVLRAHPAAQTAGRGRYDNPDNLQADLGTLAEVFGKDNVTTAEAPPSGTASRPAIRFPSTLHAERFAHDASARLAETWNTTHPNDVHRFGTDFLAPKDASVIIRGAGNIEEDIIGMLKERQLAYRTLYHEICSKMQTQRFSTHLPIPPVSAPEKITVASTAVRRVPKDECSTGIIARTSDDANEIVHQANKAVTELYEGQGGELREQDGSLTPWMPSEDGVRPIFVAGGDDDCEIKVSPKATDPKLALDLFNGNLGLQGWLRRQGVIRGSPRGKG